MDSQYPGGYKGGQQPHHQQQPYYDNADYRQNQFTGTTATPNQVPTQQYNIPHNLSEPLPAAAHYPPPQPNLPRSISTTNLETTALCRNEIQNDWKLNAPPGGTNYFATTPGFTLTLPALTDYNDDNFRQFVFSRIVSKKIQESMESEYCLNWCPNVTKLVPLYTLGDGNCLLHAASLAMWGFQDRDLVLRKALSHAVNNNSHNSTLYERWKRNREMENQNGLGFQLEPHQWHQEWKMVMQQTSINTSFGQKLESLDEFHVFVLANVLRRPIILYAAPKLYSNQTDATLQHINFHGIYLPLLWSHDACKKAPLPLAYHHGHFSALVIIDSLQQYRDGQLILPLSDYCAQALPVRFILPVEEADTLLMDYLDLVRVPVGKASPYFQDFDKIVCAKLTIQDEPTYMKPLIAGFINACAEAYFSQKPQGQFQHTSPPSSTSHGRDQRPTPTKCINNCGMYGSPETSGLCSACHRKALNAAEVKEKGVYDDPQPRGQPMYNNSIQNQQQQVYRQTSGQLSSGAIKCPRCPNPGHPNYLGLCERCFGSSTASQSHADIEQKPYQVWSQPQTQPQTTHGQGNDPIYEDLPANLLQGESQQSNNNQRPALPPPRQVTSGERSQCRIPGCEFFGTRETRYYCSKCFEENMEKILKEVDQQDNSTQMRERPHVPLNPVRFPPPIMSTSASSSVAPSARQAKPKCRRCNEFYANDEYNGMCHGCFMKMTKSDQQKSNHFNDLSRQEGQSFQPFQHDYVDSKPVRAICSSVNCHQTATESGFCTQCQMTRSIPPHQQQSVMHHEIPQQQYYPTDNPAAQRPIPKPRTKTTTTLTQHSSQQFQHIDDRTIQTAPKALLTDSMSNMSITSPPTCFLCNSATFSLGKSFQYVCDTHAQEVMDKFFGAGKYNLPEPPQHSNGDIVRQKLIHDRSPSPYEQAYPSARQYAGVPSQVPSTVRSRRGGGHDELPPFGIPLQPKHDQPTPLTAEYHGIDPSTRNPRQQPGPLQGNLSPQQVFDHGLTREWETTPPQMYNQPREFQQKDSNYVPQAGTLHQHDSAQKQYYAANVGLGGAAGEDQGMADEFKQKTLCATPGCSFKGYPDLNKLCPDCYEDMYKTPSPKQYPLV